MLLQAEFDGWVRNMVLTQLTYLTQFPSFHVTARVQVNAAL
jgi:hypothetical protein